MDKTTAKQGGLKNKQIREFPTGATRDTDEGKLDFEGFLSPFVLQRYAEYLHLHRKQSDGQMRASDNWQKGIPVDTYMKSLCRHQIDLWKKHRSQNTDGIEDALCGVIFNAMGYLFEVLKSEKE
jgi:hypothetical protein